MTIPDLSRETGISESTLRAAVLRLIARGDLPPRRGRDHQIPDDKTAAVVAEVRARGRPWPTLTPAEEQARRERRRAYQREHQREYRKRRRAALSGTAVY